MSLVKDIGIVGVIILYAASFAFNWLLTYGVCWVMMGFGHAIPFWPTFVGLWIVGVVINICKS